MENQRTLGRCLLQKIETLPNNDAVGRIIDGKVHYWTFAEYGKIIEKLSLAFIKYGAVPGTKVAIVGCTRTEWHLCDLAAITARSAVVAIYPTYASKDLIYIYNHSESSIIVLENDEQFQKLLEIFDNIISPKVIITMDRISEALKSRLDPMVAVISFDQFMTEGEEEVAKHPNLFKKNLELQRGDELASIIYTSGTTGEPKGAMITNHAFVSMLNNTIDFLHNTFSSVDTSLIWLPLSHVFGRANSLLPLIFGCRLAFSRSLEKLTEDVNIVRPTVMLSVPRIFEKIYEKVHQQIQHQSVFQRKVFLWANLASLSYFNKIENKIRPSLFDVLKRKIAYALVFSKIYKRMGGRIRFFISGGAPLAPSIIRFLRNANLFVLEGYGLTETIAPCLLNPSTRIIPGTIGLPLGDVRIRLAEDGEIFIKTEAMFSGYFKNPSETAASMEGDWFRTGDLGEQIKEGHFRITGRKKDIIITSSGKNVAPQKIENLMTAQRHIAYFVVVGDHRKFLTGIVAIEPSTFTPYLKDWGLPANVSCAELANHPKVFELIDMDVKNVNRQLANFEQIQYFVISNQGFTIKDGLLTPSLKVKKKAVIERFKNEVNALYESRREI
jgi:long-chain acyl-CoA synthetase